MARPRRLGILIPSSNTVVEPETGKLMPADGSVTAHVSRLQVVEVSNEPASLQQFDVDRVLIAVDLLADAKVDLVLWNGTASSWLGFDYDRRIVDAIERHTSIPATTAVIAINKELFRLATKRIGLVTPYIAALEARIVANYRSIGIEIVAAERRDLTENIDFADVSPDEIAGMVRGLARTSLDAVVVLCTNLAGSSVAEQTSRDLGIPVIDSVRIAVQHSLALLARGT